MKRPKPKRKYFTIEEANATLPLLRAVLRDVTELAHDLRRRHPRIMQLQQLLDAKKINKAETAELDQLKEEFGRDQEHMHEYEDELKKLHVELKDYFTGLIDFPCWMDDREVYLCWKLDEPEVAHWHELDSGFAGRQKLKQQVLN